MDKIYKLFLSFICFLVISSVSHSVLAQQKTHEVKAGDTLFSIAQEYNITVENLKEWNNLQDSEISVGQILIVKPEETEDQATIHEVKSQETLFSISKKYGVSISEIKRWNDLENNNLDVGQELTLYPSEGGNDSLATSDESLVINKDTQQNAYYTVKSGDTLYEIARAHNMSVSELKNLNDLSSDNLAIGQKLTVRQVSAPPSVSTSTTKSSPQGKFVAYKISNTQSIDDLLEKFRMSKLEFEALNPDLEATTLRPGQTITVLAPPTKSYNNPYTSSANLETLGSTAISKYSSNEAGNTTTSGELYNPEELTAAHSNIAIGTVIYIQNPNNNRGIYIRINDRISGNGLKLSEAAWNGLAVKSANPSVKIFKDQ